MAHPIRNPHSTRNSIFNAIINRFSLFQESPGKIFVAKDFSMNTTFEREYMKLLVKLGLVEVVEAYYDIATNNARKEIVGYRLRSNK